MVSCVNAGDAPISLQMPLQQTGAANSASLLDHEVPSQLITCGSQVSNCARIATSVAQNLTADLRKAVAANAEARVSRRVRRHKPSSPQPSAEGDGGP